MIISISTLSNLDFLISFLRMSKEQRNNYKQAILFKIKLINKITLLIVVINHVIYKSILKLKMKQKI